MGKHDTQPPAYGHATASGNRKKTSKHVAKHERAQARRERAYARGAERPQ